MSQSHFLIIQINLWFAKSEMIRWQISNTANCIFNGVPAKNNLILFFENVQILVKKICLLKYSKLIFYFHFKLAIKLLNFHMNTWSMKLPMKYEIDLKMFLDTVEHILLNFGGSSVKRSVPIRAIIEIYSILYIVICQ